MFSSEFDLDLNFDFKRESQKINSSSYGIDRFEQDEMRQQEFQDFCEDAISQVKQLLYIMYGTCVRFYSTVVEWAYLNRMKEDLIERISSLVFSN